MVIAMRELERLRRHDAAIPRAAAAWLTIAALLTVCLSQSFHATTPPVLATASPAASVVTAGSDLPAQHAAHDADLCSLCRATAQARLGLRVISSLGALAATGTSVPLHLPAPALASAAPSLRNAQPRAPPTTLLVLGV